mgnify:CR=1 FL=1
MPKRWKYWLWLEEVAELRVARSRDGQRKLLELGHAAVRGQVDPSTDRRARRSVAQILGVAEPRGPRVRDGLAPGGCTGGAQRTGRTPDDRRGADDHRATRDACEPESHSEIPLLSPQLQSGRSLGGLPTSVKTVLTSLSRSTRFPSPPPRAARPRNTSFYAWPTGSLAGRPLDFVDRRPAGVLDDTHAALCEQRVDGGGGRFRLRLKATCGGVLEQELDRLGRVLLVRADHARRPALDPAGAVDARLDDGRSSLGIVAALLVEGHARQPDAVVADAAEDEPTRQRLVLGPSARRGRSRPSSLRTSSIPRPAPRRGSPPASGRSGRRRGAALPSGSRGRDTPATPRRLRSAFVPCGSAPRGRPDRRRRRRPRGRPSRAAREW